MNVLNPMFNVTFQYLMENPEIAKGLIMLILEQEVCDISLLPQNPSDVLFNYKNLPNSPVRLDYLVSIKKQTPSGKVIIENNLVQVQKSFFIPEIGRFRRSMADRYKNKIVNLFSDLQEEKYIPVKTIYFIEDNFDNSLPAILKREGVYRDMVNNTSLDGKKNDFIELLNHDSWYIQLEKLLPNTQSDLLQALCIFSPVYRQSKRSRYLDIPDRQIRNNLMQLMVNRLQLAMKNDELLNLVEAELEYDDFIEKSLQYKNQAEDERKEKENERKLREEKDGQIANIIIHMYNQGFLINDIVKITGISKIEVETVINNPNLKMEISNIFTKTEFASD